MPLLKQHHLLLVTLLVCSGGVYIPGDVRFDGGLTSSSLLLSQLCNAGVNEALPLFLDRLVPTYLAVIISVTAVLFFGE